MRNNGSNRCKNWKFRICKQLQTYNIQENGNNSLLELQNAMFNAYKNSWINAINSDRGASTSGMNKLILVSHSPDFDCRWTHEIGNLQIRLWSGTHRDIRVDILSHRVFIGVISQGSAATSGVVQKSLACQKIARWLPESSFSCWVRV